MAKAASTKGSSAANSSGTTKCSEKGSSAKGTSAKGSSTEVVVFCRRASAEVPRDGRLTATKGANAEEAASASSAIE